MTPERWQRVKGICLAVLEDQEYRRADAVAELCQGDAELERDVVALMASARDAESLFERPALSSPAALHALELAVPSIRLAPGARIGAYRVISEIGRGGMGTVYLAERADDEYRQRVAVKLADAHSSAVLRWFREERQILAGLEHPNIARLLDGGTTPEGVPYLVMEYVDGLPIDEFCRTHRLSLTERLGMFRQVCAAVDFAHRHLVVHRDIKPRNILVTNGVPKLLDFGIATLIDGSTDRQSVAAPSEPRRPLTPLYASPEQLADGPITTATDVYALGVLLYVLLAGVPPFQPPAKDGTLAAAVRDREPVPPSEAVDGRERGRLSGDLDAIVLKALQREPAKRYPSAAAFIDDLDRHLSGRPVDARGDRLGYRTVKLLRRHVVAVIASVCVLIALLAGLGAALREQRQTELERQRAQRHFDNVRQLASSLIFEVNDQIETLPGSMAARQLLIRRALEYFDNLAAEERNNLGLQRELAAAYDKLGSVLGRPLRANLGDTGAALSSFRKSLAIRQALALTRPDDRDAQLELWSSYHVLTDVLRDAQGTTDALEILDEAYAVAANLLRRWPEDPAAIRAAAEAEVLRQRVWVQSGAIEKTRQSVEAGLALFGRLLAQEPGNRNLEGEIASLHGRMAIVLLKLGQPAAALPHAQQRVAMLRNEPSPDGQRSPRERRDRSSALLQLAQVLARVPDPAGAARAQREAVDLRRELATEDPSDRQSIINLVVAQMEIGEVLNRNREFGAAIPPLREAVALGDRLAAADPRHIYIRVTLLSSLVRLATALLAVDPGSRDAAPLIERAIEIARSTVEADPADARFQFELAQAYALEGDLVARRDQHAIPGAAQSWYQKSFAILTDLRGSGRLAGGTLNGDEPARMAEIAGHLEARGSR